MKRPFMVCMLAALLGAGSGAVPTPAADEAGTLRVLRRFGPDSEEPALRFDQFRLSPEVGVVPEGADRPAALELAVGELIADEMGAVDMRQAEKLSDTVWVKKVLDVGSRGDRNPEAGRIRSAELFFLGKARRIVFNGTPLDDAQPLVSTGWSRVAVPVDLVRDGLNEVVFSGKGQLKLEPGRGAGRSFKSTDGGRSWSARGLGPHDDLTGEYLVRLRLERLPREGWVTSPVIDLWAVRPGEPAVPGELAPEEKVTLLVKPPRDSGHDDASAIRLGSTPTVDERTWGPWQSLGEGWVPQGKQRTLRWAQLRLRLSARSRPPSGRLEGLALAYTFRPMSDLAPATLTVERPADEPMPRVSSIPFSYQEPSPRLQALRERYQLDKVIAPGKTEMEQLMLLRHWVRHQWHSGWQTSPAAWMPPWDALVILGLKDQPDCLTMCTHYATVFTQCCLALGWNARHCILDHHCVSEVWVEQHRKWVVMDAGNSKPRADVGLHFERRGVPLSAYELYQAFHANRLDDITVCFTPAKLAEQIADLCRPAPPAKSAVGPRPDTIPLADLPQYPVCQIGNYRRFAIPERNNYLTSLLPGELYNGYSSYSYDGYWWVGQAPEYSRHVRRAQDVDWGLNWTRIHLARTAKPRELRVDLETFTPNLARFERWIAGEWRRVDDSFVWKLEPGRNELRARSVNKFGRPGSEARVVVTVE